MTVLTRDTSQHDSEFPEPRSQGWSGRGMHDPLRRPSGASKSAVRSSRLFDRHNRPAPDLLAGETFDGQPHTRRVRTHQTHSAGAQLLHDRSLRLPPEHPKRPLEYGRQVAASPGVADAPTLTSISRPIIIKRYGNRHTARCGSVVLTTVLITALLAPLNAASFSRSKGSSGCRDCGECSCEPGAARVVAVKIYNQTRITEANLDRIIDVTNRVWSRYGINVRKSTSTDAVAVIVAGLATTFATDLRPVVLGDTLFTGGHATPYVHLWLANAEALAEEAEIEGQPFTSRPRNERDAILFQMLGVALAHELGHYLLDTAKHSSGGLLRENLTVRELVHPDPDHFRLTHEQQRLICRE